MQLRFVVGKNPEWTCAWAATFFRQTALPRVSITECCHLQTLGTVSIASWSPLLYIASSRRADRVGGVGTGMVIHGH